ncbi:MAG: hypothetical protein Q4P66_05645 [Actinomycetaceae bacterium]|nr:hypothetical protein [Actinomycetaceae bacterium]
MAAILMISLVAGLGVGFGWFSGGGYSGPPVDYSQKPMEYSLEYPSKVVYSLDFTEPIEVIALEAFTGEVTEQGEREAQFLRFTGDDFETLATVSDHVPVAVSNTVGLVMDSDTKELKLIEFSSGDITPLGFDGEKDDYYLSNDVFLRHHGNTLTAYDLNKKKMWSKRVGDSIYGAYLLSGDAIVVNSEGFDILLDKSGGKEIMKINETGKWIDAIEDGYIIGTEREHDYFTMDGEKIGTVRGPWISSLDWRDYGIKDLYRQHKEGVTQLPSQTKRSSRAGTCMGTVINIDSKAHIGDKTFDKIGDSYQWYECSPDQRTAYILDTDFDNESLTYYGFSQDSQAEPTISKQYKGVKVLPRTIYDYFRTVGVLEDESLIESDDSDYSTPTDVVDTLIIFGASNK